MRVTLRGETSINMNGGTALFVVDGVPITSSSTSSTSESAYKMCIRDRHWGMLYRNQLFRPIAVGDRTKGYVRKLTEDNRIDVSLQQEGFAQVKDSAEVLLQLVRDNGGFLPLNDDSAPEEVNRLTQTSKKVFKRSLGMLLKRGAVTVDEQGIKINE